MRACFRVKKNLLLLLMLMGLLSTHLTGCVGVSRANAQATAPAAVPAAPTGLTATSGNAQASLTWTASTGATSYHVKRATLSAGPFVLIGVPTAASFIDTGLTNGTTYFYAVSAVNSVGKSGNSPSASATPTASAAAPAAPKGLTATSGNAQASLTWAATSAGPFAQIAGPTASSFIDRGLTNGTTYFYAVSAVNSVGESANSSTASAKPPASPAAPTAPAGLTPTAG